MARCQIECLNMNMSDRMSEYMSDRIDRKCIIHVRKRVRICVR